MWGIEIRPHLEGRKHGEQSEYLVPLSLAAAPNTDTFAA